MTIGEYLKRSRKQDGITQNELAKKAGLARSFIARLERGHFKDDAMSLGTFIRLSKALKVPMYKFFEDIKYNQGNLPPMGTYLQQARKRRSNH